MMLWCAAQCPTQELLRCTKRSKGVSRDGDRAPSRLVDGVDLYFRPTEIDLAALLHDVCQLHREIALGSRIREDFGSAPLRIVGDHKLLFQVCSNLLSNAIKYSPGGGLVEVRARSDGEQVVVAVQDHGIGIPEQDLARLFERYHRGSNVNGIVGTGVGLYLVKMVIDLHGGDINTDSTEGKGCRFTMLLPIKLALPHEAPSRSAATSASNDGARPVDERVGSV